MLEKADEFEYAKLSRTADASEGPLRTAHGRPVLVTGATGRIGRAVVARLLDAGVPVRALTLGPESLSHAEQVSIIGTALGRPIRFEELSEEEFRRETGARWPGPVVDMLLTAWRATLGRPAFVTSTVADILGSPARSFRQWADNHVSAFG